MVDHVHNVGGYYPQQPRNHDLMRATWMQNPIQQPLPILTLLDVRGVTQASNGSVLLNLGYATSGEGVTDQAMMMNVPGILSLPLPVGTISNTNGAFTASSSDSNPTDGCQVLSYIRNDQWVGVGFRDTRTQPLVGALNPGETAIFCQGSKAITYYRVDGSITTQTSDGINNASIKTTPTKIDISSNTINLNSPITTAANGGASDFVSLSTLVTTNLSNIATSLNAIIALLSATPPGTTVVTVVSSSLPPFVPLPTASSTLKGGL